MFYDDAPYDEPEQPREERPQLDVYNPIAPSTAGGLNLPELVRIARELGPRDVAAITLRAREIGAQMGRILDPNPKNESTGAYYKWSAGGSVIEGPTIDLMQALATEWGRIAYQVELVSERGARVTLRARVIDLMSLVITDRETTHHLSAAPGKFAGKEEERERWRIMQLASAQSKAVRSLLEDMIPLSIVDAALEAAKDAAAGAQLGTIQVLDKDGNPVLGKDKKPTLRRRTLAEAVDAAIKGLAKLSPPPDLVLVERWIGRPRAEWVASDLAALRGLYDRWRRGEVTPEGFAAEVAEQGTDGAPVTETGATGSDRLSGLGLGTTGASNTSSPLSPAPATDGGPPSPSGDAAASADKATSEKRAPTVGEDLDALIRGLEQAGGPIPVELAKDRFKRIAMVGRLVASRWDPIIALGVQVGKIRVDGNLVSLVPPAATATPAATDRSDPPASDPIEAMSLAELVAECQALGHDLGSDTLKAALDEVGMPSIDGAPAPMLRDLLRALLARLPDEVAGV